jgi:hypothetical protein
MKIFKSDGKAWIRIRIRSESLLVLNLIENDITFQQVKPIYQAKIR